ncbi:hypothetical protein V6N13_078495 [Hibiscus sabdariffa]
MNFTWHQQILCHKRYHISRRPGKYRLGCSQSPSPHSEFISYPTAQAVNMSHHNRPCTSKQFLNRSHKNATEQSIRLRSNNTIGLEYRCLVGSAQIRLFGDITFTLV